MNSGYAPRDPETDIQYHEEEDDDYDDRTRSTSAVDVYSPRARGLKGNGDWACRSSRINSPFPGPETFTALFDETRGSPLYPLIPPFGILAGIGAEFESSPFNPPPRK